jgi:hypothetical protein
MTEFSVSQSIFIRIMKPQRNSSIFFTRNFTLTSPLCITVSCIPNYDSQIQAIRALFLSSQYFLRFFGEVQNIKLNFVSVSCGTELEYDYLSPGVEKGKGKRVRLLRFITGPPCDCGTYIQRPGPPCYELNALLTNLLRKKKLLLLNPKK